MKNKRKPEIFFLSTYPPRGCGIATFTKDIVTELKKRGSVCPQVIAIDDGQDFYSEDVVACIGQQDHPAYETTADLINCSADLLMIEHEYGIYGGPDGGFLLSLAGRLRIPYIVTCHTVLPDPGVRQKSTLAELCRSATGVVVMSQQSSVILQDIYGVEKGKIRMIHHGVPVHTFLNSRELLKKEIGFDKHTVITTFGLLSPGKGLEYGIQAVAEVAVSHPDIRYLILGQTHPAIKRQSGEEYRNSLKALADRLGISKHVIFDNRYLSQNEIMHYLYLSDIYMTPYLGKDQAVSGTMAYAIGCGRAVVSTPYMYAREMLADGRGLLAEFESASSLAYCLNMLIENPKAKTEMERKALALGRTMAWAQVAEAYEDAFLYHLNGSAKIMKEGYHGTNVRASL